MQEQADEALEKCSASAKQMCITGLKKTDQNLKSNYQILELDELYCFIGKKPKTETRENTYVMTMVSRLPRQIVGFDAAFDKSPERIQKIVITVRTQNATVLTVILVILMLFIRVSIFVMLVIKAILLLLRV